MKPFLHSRGSIGLLAALPLLFVACNKESHAGSTPPAGSNAPSMMDQAKSAGAEFQKTANDALAAVDQKIAELETKASAATDSAKTELDAALASLDEKRRAFSSKLAELKAEAPDKAHEMVEKMKTELADLKKSAEDAAARFK